MGKNLLPDRFDAHQDDDARDGNCNFRQHVACVINQGIKDRKRVAFEAVQNICARVVVHYVAEKPFCIAAPQDIARKEMAHIAQKPCDQSAERKGKRRLFDCFAEHSGKAEHHKRGDIVKKRHQHHVKAGDSRERLAGRRAEHRLQHAEHEAAQKPPADAVHVAEHHQRHHAEQRDGAAIRKVENLDHRKHRSKGDQHAACHKAQGFLIHWENISSNLNFKQKRRTENRTAKYTRLFYDYKAYTKQESKLPPPALSGSGIRVAQPRSQPKYSTPVFLFNFVSLKSIHSIFMPVKRI